MPPQPGSDHLFRLKHDVEYLKAEFVARQNEVCEARAKYKRCERVKERRSQEQEVGRTRLPLRNNPDSMGTTDDDLAQRILSLRSRKSEAEGAAERAEQDLRTAMKAPDDIKEELRVAISLVEDYVRSQRSAAEAKERQRLAKEAAQRKRQENAERQRKIAEQARKIRERQEAAQRERQEDAAEQARKIRERREAEEKMWRERDRAFAEAREREQKARDRKVQEERSRGEQERQREPEERPRRQKRRSKQESKPLAAPRESSPITEHNIAAFFAACQAMPSDLGTLEDFPDPPSEPCKQVACKASAKDRKLAACPCNIKKVFSVVQNLKIMRNRFHPDRFARCPEDVHQVVEKKAQEIFVVLSEMLETGELRERELKADLWWLERVLGFDRP